MLTSQGKKENGIEVGNHFDKYGSKNPIAKYLMQGFMNALDDLVSQVGMNVIYEAGCGEGHLTLRWLSHGISVRGSDFSKTAINLAIQNANEYKLPLVNNLGQNIFSEKSIYELTESEDSAPLVVCCEVLEHLEDPELALQKLVSIAKPWLILSVPREPVWCAMNMVRGKYFLSLGNTPGHIQHWSKKSFINMVIKYAEIIEIKSPLPWTMLLCKVRST